MRSAPKPRRRWFQFSVADYGVLLTAIAVVWWWIAKESYPHQCAEYFGAISVETAAALDEFGTAVGIGMTLIVIVMWFVAVMSLRCLGYFWRQWRGRRVRTH
jgi:hypothetical protein